jgi:cobalt-zinc-cadmium efflux system membrane fusion protein
MSWQKVRRAAGASAVMLLACVLACQRSASSQHSHEHAPASSSVASHAHEASQDGHEALPGLVKVPPEVVRDAGIKLERVGKAALAEVLDLPGEVNADPDRVARLSSPAAGRIEEVRFREGESVKRGAPLVVIRVPEIARVRASHMATQAKAKAARSNAGRLRTLASEQLSTEQEALNAEAEAEALEVEARAMAEQLGALGAVSGAFLLTLRAPIDGSVVARDAVVGQPATADQTLGTIANLSKVWFLARVFEKDLGQLRVGAVAEVHLNAYADEHFAGTVEYIGQQIDPIARTVKARIPLENPRGLLRLGLFGTCQISLAGPAKSEPKLVIARSSVTDVAGKSVVFVREREGEFELHKVTLGRESLGKVEVLEGLREGEEVVTDGVFTLKSLVLKGSFGEEHH